MRTDNRGEAYRKKKLYGRAVADYEKAVSIDPRFAEAYYNLGLVYEYGEKKDALAAAAYANYLKNNPKASDREAVTEKIRALKTAAAKPAPATHAAAPKPGAHPGAKPAGPPGVKPAPGTQHAQVQKPPAPGAHPGHKPPSAVPHGARPGMPGHRPGLPPHVGVKPPAGPQLPAELPFGQDLKPLIAMAMGFGLVLLVVPVLIYVFVALMLFLIAKKTNTAMPWLAFIPIAQFVLVLNIAGKPIWWIVVFFLPAIGSALGFVDQTVGTYASLAGSVVVMIASLLIALGIANARGKSVVWGILLFLPCTSIIALPYLALSK